eukprot:Skav231791  [mRNA]  locus=scaffold734:37701:41060:+ [translate_table: standard]
MEGRAVGLHLGLNDGTTASLEEVEQIFQGLDTAFVYIFLLELLLRIFAERGHFFYDAANWFDTILVLVGLADIWIIAAFGFSSSTDPQNIVMMRLFRAVKCLRAIRMVRTFRLFRGLNLLVKACQCFLPSLGWSMVLLVVFMSMGTLILGNLLRTFIEDTEANFEDRVWIWNRYGTAYRAMYTLYEAWCIALRGISPDELPPSWHLYCMGSKDLKNIGRHRKTEKDRGRHRKTYKDRGRHRKT